MAQLLASIVVLIAINSKIYERNRLRSYGNAVGAIAFIFSILGLVYHKMDVADKRVAGEFTLGSVNSMFLLIWWFFGAMFLTFKGPFVLVGNGYFAVWAGLFFAMPPFPSRERKLAGSVAEK
jgi:hypothetical protein